MGGGEKPSDEAASMLLEKERRESEISRLCTGTPVRAGALRRKEREVRSLIRLTVENN